MSVLSVGASALAHGVHYAVLGVGLLGLLALLGPQLVRSPRSPVRHDDHARRVRAVQDQIAAGSLGASVAVAAVPVRPSAVPIKFASGLLPMAVVSSAAAAGAHAAVGPAHFDEQLIFGLFFAGSALAQILWSVAIVVRPSRAVLGAAVIGNAALVLLWLATRTVGLPGGLLPRPEAVGLWDLCCAFWEITVVVICAHLLRSPNPGADLRLPLWSRWPRTAQHWALGSALVLGLLSLSGAGA